MALTKTAIPYLTRVFGAARGCSMGCPYCSTARWSHRLACPKCRACEVHFHEERLGDPASAKKPQVIGVSFYDELWDPLRPDLDILRVLAACDAAPQHRYVFLTKRPERVDERIAELFGRHKNWWLGVTVTGGETSDREARACSILAYVWTRKGIRTWLSLEPWWGGREPATLNEAIAASEFTVIGSQSGGSPVEPGVQEALMSLFWDVFSRCRHYLRPVYVKQVWVNGRCSRDPGQWPEGLRVWQLPEEWAAIKKG